MATISAVGNLSDSTKQRDGKAPTEKGPTASLPKQRSPNIAVFSWGHGIVSTSRRPPSPRGVVTSRGISQKVNPTVAKKKKTKTSHSSTKCDDKLRTATSEEHQAAIIIQKHIRGYQARKMRKREEVMAKKIQRQFRSWKDSMSQDYDSSTIAPSEISTDPSIGSQTQLGDLQTEIDKLSFAAEAQFEGLTIGDNCDPPRVVLIASNVPNAYALQRCVLEGVLSTVYEFADNTLPAILRKLRILLNGYRPGVKAKSVALVCQGGPGFVYLLAGKVITPAKISTNKAISKFWVALGDMISKINPTEACVDFIASNVSGNRQGEQLLRDLEKIVQPNVVHMRSLLEVSSEGQQMLGSYFNVTSYKTWKTKRHSKILLT